ncbi:MAG TPA: hypothetical protein VL970_10415, partial [Candidatus Acidoferrales bacterium]|nr:hypothetical protein [Candidatus Acidoferrales bacterium]
DKVTQSNAANAEEGAAAAEELNSQAAIMNQSVNELMELVGSKNDAVAIEPVERINRSKKPAAAPLVTGHRAASRVMGDGPGKPVKPCPPSAAGRRMDLPLDGNFGDSR